MIGLKVNGEFLDLPPNFNFPFVWESSLFSDEIVMNGFSSLPIMLPFTPKNKRLLNYFHKPELSFKNIQINCELHLANNFWCKGVLTVNVKGESFDCDFAEITNFSQSADKKLSELFTNEDVYNLIIPYKRWWAFNFSVSLGASFYRLDVYVNGTLHRFDSDGVSTLEEQIDQIYDALLLDSDITDKFNITRVTGAPTFEEIIYIEDKVAGIISQTDNYNIVCAWLLNSVAYGDPVDWISHQSNLIKTALNALLNTTYPNSPYCFPTIKNQGFYADKNSSYTSNNKLVNSFSEESYDLNNYIKKYVYTLSPQFFLKEILSKIASKFSSGIDGTLFDIPDIRERAFVYNNFAIDLICIDGYYLANVSGAGDLFNIFSGQIFIKNHLPDATLKEFLNSLKNYLGVGFFFRNGILSVDTLKSILESSDEVDWTNKSFRVIDQITGNYENGYLLQYSNDSTDVYLNENLKSLPKPLSGIVDTYSDLPKNPTSGEYWAVLDEKVIYISQSASLLSNIPQATWSKFTNYLHDFPILTPEIEIQTGVSPTLNDWHLNVFRKIYVPIINQPGSSNEFQIGINPVPTRLMMYWGPQFGQIRDGGTDLEPEYSPSSDGSVTYPYASIDNTHPEAGIIGDVSLRFDGEDGLYELLLRDWYKFRERTKNLVIQIILSKTELLQLSLTNKIKIGTSKFLIAKVQGNVSSIAKDIICTVDLKKL